MANEDIANVAGGFTGVQKILGVHVSTGGIRPLESVTHPSGTVSIPDITGKYQNRFDDPTYY